MQYQIVYDIEHPVPALPAGVPICLLFLVVGLAIWRLGDRSTRWRVWPLTRRKALGVVFALGGAAALLVVTASTLSWRADARRWLHDGTARVVAGPVEHYEFDSVIRASRERFSVGGVQFEYSPADASGRAFAFTQPEGGPIHEGLDVRIHYLPSRPEHPILKLEVAR